MSRGRCITLLFGNVGSDPELRYTRDNSPVLSFRVATTEGWTDKRGERQEATEWHSVVVWGKSAESLSKLLRKGSRVFVEGSNRTRSWKDKDNEKITHYRTEVIAREVTLGDRKPKDSESGPPPEETPWDQ